jgi:hypothetical protein
MKNQHKKLDSLFFDIKRYNEKKKANKEKKYKAFENKLNCDKKSNKVDKSLVTANSLKNNEFKFNKRYLNKSMHYFNINKQNEDEKKILKKEKNKPITNQYIDKNYKINEKINSNNTKPNKQNNIFNNKTKPDFEKVDREILSNKKKEMIKSNDSNKEGNKCSINNNILFLINSNNGDNIIRFDNDNNNLKKNIIKKNNSSSKIYPSAGKELQILNYNDMDDANNINKKLIYTSKNNIENKSKFLKERTSNYIYKKIARNDSCIKKKKYFDLQNDLVMNNNKKYTIDNFYISKTPYYKKNEKERNTINRGNNINLQINEDFNRNNNQKSPIHQTLKNRPRNSINMNNSNANSFDIDLNNSNNDGYKLIEKNEKLKTLNKTNIYNRIRTKKIIKSSLRKKKSMNCNAQNKNDYTHDAVYYKINDDINQNNRTTYINRTKMLDNYQEYINNYKNNYDINSVKIDNDFNKTTMNVYKNANKIIEPLNSRTIKDDRKYFYNDYNTIQIKDKEMRNKMNKKKKPINIYYKKNINNKTGELNCLVKSNTYKKDKNEKYSICSSNISNKDDIFINSSKENEDIQISDIENSIFENINSKVNNNTHCFIKKFCNYYVKKYLVKVYYIDKRKSIKRKKEKSLDTETRLYSNNKNKNIMSNFQKISLGAEKLNEIFVKKNDNDISIKIKRAMTEEEFYVGSDKLNKKNYNEDIKDVNNTNIEINNKIYTYKMTKKNRLLEDEVINNKKELKIDKILKNEKTDINNKLNNTNNQFYTFNNDMIKKKDNNSKDINEVEKLKKNNKITKKKAKSTEKRRIELISDKKENKDRNQTKEIILKDFENYLNYLEKENINKKEEISENINDSYDWKQIDELITKEKTKIEDIIRIYIDICKENKIETNNIFKENEYIKTIIEYYSSNLSKNQKEIIHLNMIEIFNDINSLLTDENMYVILGNLLFILLKNKLYYIKDLNNFIDKEKNIQINIAKVVKYAILASGNLSKQYHNDFKYTKLFNNNDIFVNYITKEIFK